MIEIIFRSIDRLAIVVMLFHHFLELHTMPSLWDDQQSSSLDRAYHGLVFIGLNLQA